MHSIQQKQNQKYSKIKRLNINYKINIPSTKIKTLIKSKDIKKLKCDLFSISFVFFSFCMSFN